MLLTLILHPSQSIYVKSDPQGSQFLTTNTISTEAENIMIVENDKITFESNLQPSSQVIREINQ